MKTVNENTLTMNDELNLEELENVNGGVRIVIPTVPLGPSLVFAKLIARWGIRIAEKLTGKDLNGNGKIGA